MQMIKNYVFQCATNLRNVAFKRFFIKPIFKLSDDYAKRTKLYYIISAGIFMIGFGYSSVPLYRIYCSKTGSGTNANYARAKMDVMRSMKRQEDREVVLHFSADTPNMSWNFKPSQSKLVVVPGETILAFYTACNPTDRPVVGIATYSVVPFEASIYFHKIQCFCFEEQLLNPHEEVDLPILFYLDPEFADDPRLLYVDNIVLHYTFFEAKESRLYIPGITQPALNP